MKFAAYEKEAAFAIENVRMAAQLAKNIQDETRFAEFTKKDQSPVTAADFAIQALVSSNLQKEFPKDVLVGEEDSSTLMLPEGKNILERVCHYVEKVFPGKNNPAEICRWIDHGKSAIAKRFWTIDPIDGTKGFVRGDQFAVAFALIEDGDVKVGVLGCPNLVEASELNSKGSGSLIVAVRGQGCWQQPLQDPKAAWKRMKVSECSKPQDAVLLRSFEKSHNDTSLTNRLVKEFGIQKESIQMDSLAKYAVLASGSADLMLRFPMERHSHEYIWDQAAGQIAIEEAGGRVTDLDGKTLDYTQGRRLTANRGVLLSNGHLHKQVLEAIRSLQTPAS